MNTISPRLAVLDMAGTTVADDGLVLRAFDAAAGAAGLPADGPDHDRAASTSSTPWDNPRSSSSVP